MATKTLKIALDEELLKEVEAAVQNDLDNLSGYFRRLALADINRRRRWARLLNESNAKGRKLGITSEVQVYEKLGRNRES